MKRIATAITALILMTGTAWANLGPLVTTADLTGALQTDPPIILDIRAPRAAEGKPNVETYTAGHIPGAINAPYGRFRGPAENPGQPPSEADLTTLLRELGLEADSRVVIVHQGKDETDFGAAARVYWTLKSSGLTQLSILNGGLNAWVAAGQPLSTDGATAQPSTISVAFSDQWTASADDIRAILAGQDQALLLDARPEAFWSGETSHAAAARPGTLPQSRYFEHAGWFGNGPAIIDATAARALAEAQGFSTQEQLVSFCNTGHWAATNWFALSELAGLENVKLYPESMVGWSNAGGEMANVPGPIRNLWIQIKNIF
ncbi:sulfurtransferase [uncultured Roseicyclus sp.]|jgi:thiosulfate/3-mercaptopyruvate sulfurtransferase|uniref:sulfurtransferase n=1 Tax=uncultured Roseicyclus sp. TaxID=543072 RepID=UPI0026294741|nr:rhodanese-like domain-containing protein [uncultured Roseicyclus sp.]